MNESRINMLSFINALYNTFLNGTKHVILPLKSALSQGTGVRTVYKTWPPIGWHRAFGIDGSKYRLGLPSAPLHYGPM